MTPAFDLPRPLFTEALGAVILIVYSLFAQSVGIQATGCHS